MSEAHGCLPPMGADRWWQEGMLWTCPQCDARWVVLEVRSRRRNSPGSPWQRGASWDVTAIRDGVEYLPSWRLLKSGNKSQVGSQDQPQISLVYSVDFAVRWIPHSSMVIRVRRGNDYAREFNINSGNDRWSLRLTAYPGDELFLVARPVAPMRHLQVRILVDGKVAATATAVSDPDPLEVSHRIPSRKSRMGRGE